MESINFDEGYVEFAINGDENRILRFNPADIGIVDRMQASVDEMKAELQKIEGDVTMSPTGNAADQTSEMAGTVRALNKALRDQVDALFYPGASDVIFGRMNPLALSNGKTVYESFFEAMMKAIKPYIDKEAKKSQKDISKYKEAYDRMPSGNLKN